MGREERDIEQEIDELIPICPEQDVLETKKGVLLANEIAFYATDENHKMITPFDSDNLKPAGYRLTLGQDYAIGGRLKKLFKKPGKNKLTIPPFEVVIISTNEIINLPRFLIARWNLRVSLVYEGLLWLGGPQVDPGYVGQLFCPIYNLSSEEVTLELGQPIVLIDFIKTTSFENAPREYLYRRPSKRTELKDYNWRLKSALFTEAYNKIKETENKVKRVESYIGLIFTSIAILFAMLTILISSASAIALPLWIYGSVALSIAAISISLFSRIGGWDWYKLKEKPSFNSIMIVYMILSAIIIALLAVKVWFG